MKAIHIEWDTDGNDDVLNDLPTEIEVPKGMVDEDEISDYLSDVTGFCHFGFELTDVKMRKLDVTVSCMAVYNSSIEVPEYMDLDEAIEYARENIKEIPLGNLEYVPDSDELDEVNCSFREPINNSKDFKKIAECIVSVLDNCRFDDITDSSGYFILKEFEDGTDRAVDVHKSTFNGQPHYVIYCSYEDEQSDYKSTDSLSVDELADKLKEIYYSEKDTECEK